jgi:DNA modification methylase
VKPEYTTVWSFPERGNWATHKGDFRGNWGPQIPKNLILRYTSEGELVLDQMVGSGTTLIECRLLNRRGIGYDINPEMIRITKERLDFESSYNRCGEVIADVGDARRLDKLNNESVDLIATHPPYLNIIKYSGGKIKEDLSNICSVDKFCEQIELVAYECLRVLKPNRYCAILIGDTRRKTMYVPLAYEVMTRFLGAGFRLKEDIIKCQWNCKSTPFWEKRAQKYNFLLIMHEHIFVFQKK